MADAENNLVKQTETDGRVSSATILRTSPRSFVRRDKLPSGSFTPPSDPLFTFKKLRRNIGGFIARIFTW